MNVGISVAGEHVYHTQLPTKIFVRPTKRPLLLRICLIFFFSLFILSRRSYDFELHRRIEVRRNSKHLQHYVKV